jgi:hypothetical protein
MSDGDSAVRCADHRDTNCSSAGVGRAHEGNRLRPFRAEPVLSALDLIFTKPLGTALYALSFLAGGVSRSGRRHEGAAARKDQRDRPNTRECRLHDS